MDKRVIFAVAGSGKTSYVVNSLSLEKRSLIVTYTTSNYENLSKRIAEKFDGCWPENITLMSFFEFLYRFCYKPFLSDAIGARGIVHKANPNRYVKQTDLNYYLSPCGYFYSNRLAFFLEKQGIIGEIRERIERYYDEFVIDEIQDIAGRDFNYLELLMNTNVNMLFVGDFYQHTYDTSRDGNVNQSLFDNRVAYEARFLDKGILSDSTTLVNSWRCGKKICDFVSANLGVYISSNRDDDGTDVFFVTNAAEKEAILNNPDIVKLHFKESYKYGAGHRNWGDTKGEDNHNDVCVMLNKITADHYQKKRLYDLSPSTRNKLYVALTRAHGNVYLMYE
ncbi:MAG: hypothetical protein IK077_04415 [Thermoguttaceae bacterium]|nr:hypothetical protein [Thermoguttaceae bacterium]